MPTLLRLFDEISQSYQLTEGYPTHPDGIELPESASEGVTQFYCAGCGEVPPTFVGGQFDRMRLYRQWCDKHRCK